MKELQNKLYKATINEMKEKAEEVVVLLSWWNLQREGGEKFKQWKKKYELVHRCGWCMDYVQG